MSPAGQERHSGARRLAHGRSTRPQPNAQTAGEESAKPSGDVLDRLEEAGAVGRSFISGLPDAGLLVVDKDLRIIRVEGAVYVDVDRDAVLLRRVPDVLAAHHWDALEPRYEAALDGHAQSFEYNAPGLGSTYAVRLAPIRDDTDAVVGAMVLSEDVTAQASARKQLAQSERLHSKVLEVLGEGVIATDRWGRLVQANPAACSILGIDLPSALDDPDWWERIGAMRTLDGPALDRSPSELGEEVLATGSGVRGVGVELDRGGAPVVLSVDYLPLRDASAAITGLALSFRDATARERERRELRELQTRLREAHEVAQLSSWEWRPATDEVLIVQALGSSESMSGTSGTLDDLMALMPVEDHQAVRDDFAEFVSGQRDQSIKRHCYQLATGEAWLETRARAERGVDGELICVRGTSQDVTEQELARQSLAETRDFLQATLDSLPSHVAVLDADGEIIMTNRAWAKFGEANELSMDREPQNYLAVCDAAAGDEVAARVAAGLRSILVGGENEFRMEYPCHGPDEERWFVLRVTRCGEPGQGRVVVTHDDVTERHRAGAELATQAALLNEVDVSVVATDLAGRVTHWNRGAERFYGWSAAEALGRVSWELIVRDGRDWPAGTLSKLRAEGHWEGEFDVCRKDGTVFPTYLRTSMIFDAEGSASGMIGVSVDVSERVASRLSLLAARDHLQTVTDSLGEGLFTLDTEGRVTYLNPAAETLLGWSASELLGWVIWDVIASGRPANASATPEASPIMQTQRDGQTVRVEDDVFTRRDGRDLAVAYTASPLASEDGVRGCVVVFQDITERKAREEMTRRDVETLASIERVQDAIANERFLLYAQPIVDLRTGEVVQQELLLRVREASGEIVGPGAYLPIAEQYGLIGEIDRWVIRRGVEIAPSGQPVQINVSARSIGDSTVLEHVERCIERSAVDPELLVFEITETAVAEDESAALLFAEKVRQLGYKLALDDFGTGFGSFTYVKHFPVDFLKIDIEFVRDLVSDIASRNVVEAVVALARAFSLKTVAEGVEDAETLGILRALGVDFAQGYHLGRPSPLALEGRGE